MRFYVANLIFIVGIILLEHQAHGIRRNEQHSYPPCDNTQFKCFDGKCVKRSWWCDGTEDCADGSDEASCKSVSGNDYRTYGRVCISHAYEHSLCKDNLQCYPSLWKCNSVVDCRDGSDEEDCPNEFEKAGGSRLNIHKAIHWTLERRDNNSFGNKWGTEAPRIALMLFMGDEAYFRPGNSTGEEISFEITIRILGAILRHQDTSTPVTELAKFINAMMVTCQNPRKFHGMDLVARLRETVRIQTSVMNPYALLTLCNAQDEITANDVEKLLHLLKVEQHPFSTDIQALAMMALSCASNQGKISGIDAYIKQCATKIKATQRSDGSFETLQTTGLVMQALIATGEDDDDSWDFAEAVKYLVKSQKEDGSFVHFLDTYYVFPVLKYKSLVNITMTHCKQNLMDTELDDSQANAKDRIHVHYSIMRGDAIDIAFTMTLMVSQNTTFFQVMKLAALTDENYKFEVKTFNSKPYVCMVSHIYNDPEQGKFWHLYKGNGTKVTNVFASPEDVIVANNEKYVMWYKNEYWTSESGITELPEISSVSENDTRISSSTVQ